MIKFWKNIFFLVTILLVIIVIDNVSATPRCGTTDNMIGGRNKRFVLHPKFWASKNLTYKITKYTKQLKQSEVDDALRKAFDRWSTYTELKFTQLPPRKEADIEIKFEKGDHHDGFPFDGPGNELAHGFYGGDLHFDDDEKWSVSGSRWDGISLYNVAVHEIGHSLGLQHSEIRKALMAPHYDAGNQGAVLHEDDIKGIQEIYGKKKNHFDINLCVNPVIDTIFNTFNGKVFLFKENHYYELKDMNLVDGPKLINQTWVGLPSKIEAAFYHPALNKTFFFKDSEYYRFTHTKMDINYPRLIREGFPGMLSHLDDALLWNVDKKLYFFKGSKYHRIEDTIVEGKVMNITSGNITDFWNKIPNHIDAAFTNNNNVTYFFKDDEFYDYLGQGKLEDAKKFNVKSYLTVDYWFNCTNTDSSFSNWWKQLKRKFKNDFLL